MTIPFDWKTSILMGMVLVADLFALEMTFPFLVFMVEDFHLNQKFNAFYTGIVGSAFGFGQLISGFLWGKASDKIGRKIPLCIGLLGNAICMICFGFSKNIYMAVGLQFVQGIMNGNFGITFAVLFDSFPKETIGKALGNMGFFYGIGLSLSNAVSGTTANLAKTYPSSFGDIGFFREYPFALPCLISATYTIITLGCTILFQRGTKKESSDMLLGNESQPLITPSSEFEKDRLPSLKTKLVFFLCLMVAIHWWTSFGFMQMLGVWTSLPINEGGLEFSSLEISIFFISWGVLLFPFYGLFWPYLLAWKDKKGQKLQAWHPIRFGLFLNMIEFACYPFLNGLAANHRSAMWLLLEIIIIIGVISINIYYFAIQLIVNNSVVPSLSGGINGLVTTCLALGKAVAPFTSGLLFSWTLQQSTFPIDFHFLFFVFSFIQLISLVTTFIIPYFYPFTNKIRLG